jgi:hypothetical protein
MAVAITAIVFSGILLGYVQSANEAEWTGYSAAASALAIQQLEQARTALYDPTQNANQIYGLTLLNVSSNNGVMTGYTWTNLDVPISGTNYTRATNYITIKPIYPPGTGSNITVMMVEVDTAWQIPVNHVMKLFTNTLVDYYGPDSTSLLLFNNNP